jgi:hypothetical protein
MCIYNNTVYAFEGTIISPKRVMALELSNGAIKYYSPSLPGDGDQEVPFTIGPNGTIYVIRDGGKLHALRDNGSAIVEIWNYTTIPCSTVAWTQFGCGPDSTLYVPNGRKIFRFNHQTGMPMDSSEELVSAGNLVPRISIGANGLVYVGNGASEPSQGKFYGLTANLQTMWSVAATYNYYSGPAIGEDGILVFCGGGTNITAFKTSVSVANNNIPSVITLEQNYPNPFNPMTVINYDVAKKDNVSLMVYDITGKLVATLVNEIITPGKYQYTFHAGGLASGIYYYELRSGSFVDTKKMVLVK